jgi:hypothetical protein
MRIENVAHIWEAYAAPRKPLCLAGAATPKHPNGISVTIYFTRKGRIDGVLVYDGDTEETLASVGKVPPPEDS